MRPTLFLAASSLVLTLGPGFNAAAGPRPAIREARSDNGAFRLRIEPGRPARPVGRCQATLEARGTDGAARRWSRPLVNEIGPMQAFVRDDGRYVVTLDESGYGGARHALVIYGPGGELLRHFLLTDLLTPGDWRHVRVRGRELVWLAGARCTFNAATDHFEIELRWGRTVRIDLRTLAVVGEGRASAAAADLPPDVAEALFTLPALDEPGEAAPAARAAGSELQTLAPEDEAHARAVQEDLAGQSVQEQPAQRQEPSGAPPQAPAGADAGQASGLVVEAAAPEAADRWPLAAGHETILADEGPAERPGDAGRPEPASGGADVRPTPAIANPEAAELTGIAVPAPDPAAKTDYLQWLNSFADLTGPNAAALYEQAFTRFMPFSGDPELLWAAERGEPAALAGPEIQAWLAANADALAAFRAAGLQDACAWTYRSPDGTLLGVDLPHLRQMRMLAKAAWTEGQVLALEGRAAAAAERYLSIAAASRHLGSRMTLIENLFGAGLQALASEALLDLQSDPAAETQLDYAALAREVRAAYQPLRGAAEVIQGERAAFLDTAQRLWSRDPATGAWHVDRAQVVGLLRITSGESEVPEDEVRRAALADELERTGWEATVAAGNAVFDRLTRALQQPYADGCREIEALGEELRQESANPLVRALVPELGRYYFAATRSEAQRRAALLVTELNAYRRRTGRYPAALEEIGADVLDPFTGRSFVYRRTADGFTLYSVGGNGVDDAGRHDPQSPDGDLVFWPRPR